MKFKTIAEAFNYYRNYTVEALEKRAAEISVQIDTDENVDMTEMNIELDGLKQAKENAELRSAESGTQFNPITGMGFQNGSGQSTAETDVLASMEYRNAFYKSLMGKSLTTSEKAAFDRAQAEQRADSFSSTTDTAAIIPTQTMNEVVSKARTMGGLLSVCRGFNVPAKISIPIGTPATKAKWNTEGEQVESEKPTIDHVSFGAFEIIKVFSISAAVKKMSIQAFESYLTEELAACVMACLADGVINGTGADQGTGILEGITWVDGENSLTFGKGGVLTYGDVVKVVSMLKRGYANGATWVMNNATLYRQFYGMVDANMRPIFIADPKSETIGKILGFPVVVDDYLENEVILFGNFNYMGYNLPEGIALESSNQSSFKSGRIDYRAMAIADCKPIVQEAFVKLTRVVE